MLFTLLVTVSSSNYSAHTAYHFCKALLEKEQNIASVFFHNEGVLNANKYIDIPTDELNLTQAWQALATTYNIKLQLCSTAALRRGITEDTIASGFELTGLGQLIEASIRSDRFLTFSG